LGISGGGKDAGGGGAKWGRERGLDRVFADRGTEEELRDAASFLRVVALAESSVDSFSDLTAALAEATEDSEHVFTAKASDLLSRFQS